MPMPALQEIIYHLEVGAGTRLVKRAALILGLLVLTGYYDWRDYKDFAAPEAMDTAQLARNLATGKGYTTDFIRPLSLYLLERDRPDRDPLLKGNHPDLANAPLYPVLLAGLMKVLPFHFEIPHGVPFLRYQPEMLIAFFNQGLFFVAIWMVFGLAKRLFDEPVAWLSTFLLAGSELFWRFSVSGLSTLLLVVIFLGLTSTLVHLEQGCREANRSVRWTVGWTLLAGALVGLGSLTRYSFGWLILPVLGLLAWVSGPRRTLVLLAAVIAFVAVLAPWVGRNLAVCGAPFGTAGYAVYAETPDFPGDVLDRSFSADLHADPGSTAAAGLTDNVGFRNWLRKLLVNTNQILQNDLPRLGGSWIAAFFLVGLLVPFLSLALARVRLFVLACLGLLVVVEALGRTHLSSDTPDLNSENLLVLVAPLAFIYGAGMYYLLLDQLGLPFPELRRLITAAFGLLMCAPLGFALLPPRVLPLVYPPYYPPLIQQVSAWLDNKELMMSDIPWAVAWYGQRSAIWLTLNPQQDFFAINDDRHPVAALYLSQATLDKPLQTGLLGGKDREWGRFFLELLRSGQVPTGFPLRQAYSPLLPEGQLFLSGWQRWNQRVH